MFCMPLRWTHQAIGDMLSNKAWIRVMSAVSILGCFLLFREAGRVIGAVTHLGCSVAVILAAATLFPSFYIGESLACGIMHQHVLKPGSLLDGNHTQLYYNLVQGVARFLGPWLSRAAVAMYGQDAFAMQQTIVCMAFLGIYEVCVNPNVQVGKASASL